MGLFKRATKDVADIQNRHSVDMPPGLLPPSREHVVPNPQRAMTVTAVWRAVQILCNTVSGLELKTYRYEDRIENPLLVNNPSVFFNRKEFLFQTMSSMVLYGEAFWLKSYGPDDQVNNLTIVHPQMVTITQEPGEPIYYWYQEQKFTRSGMAHLKLFSEPTSLRGIGPIQACHEDIVAALNLREYAAAWYSSSGIPSGVLTSAQQINGSQANDLRERWESIQEQRRVAVLGNGFAYDSISVNPKDALFVDVQDSVVQQIARLFGIPATLLLIGITGSSQTYQNVEQENQSFLNTTLKQYTDSIELALSECLPRGNKCMFDFSTLLRTDTKNRFEAYKTAVEAGFMTINEVRKSEGLPPVEEVLPSPVQPDGTVD